MKRRLSWIIVIAVLVLGAAGAWWWTHRAPAPVWRTAPLTRGPVEVTVTATGTLEAVTTVEVGTQVSGIVASLHADFNSRVKKGQVIARIDTTLLHAALVDAQAVLERAAAQERQAAAERDRARELARRDLISRSEWEAAEAAARVAAANLSSARAGLERARINLRYAIIESPIDGIVLDRAVDPGQTVAASLNAPTLFTLAGDLREMLVRAAVDEADIGRVRAGQRATFTVDAYPDTVFSGRVEQVRLQPKVTQNVVTYDVILRAENPDMLLMPGMTASLTIVTARRDSALRAPAVALRFVPPRDGAGLPARRPAPQAADRGRLYILENGAPREVAVQTGLSDGARVQILASEIPLKAGMEVIVGQAGGAPASAPSGAPFGMQPRGGARR